MTTTHRILASAGGPPPQADGDGRWYEIRAAADAGGKTTGIDIYLYDDIGYYGIRAVHFLRELQAIDDGVSPITVCINSLGGDVFEGIAIHNTLKRLGKRVTARIDGVAASIASVIAVGAHQVIMPANTMLMIHNPWAWTCGEADELRETADMMDKVRASLLRCYLDKAPELSEADLVRMMDDTTWLTAQESVALGLADVIADTVQILASASQHTRLARMQNAPAALLSAVAVIPPAPAPAASTPPAPAQPPASADPVALAKLAATLCNSAGLSALTDFIVQQSALADEATIRQHVDQAVAVRDLCVVAKLPGLADGYIRAGLDQDAVRSKLFNKLLALDGADIDNSLPPEDDPRTPGNGLNPKSIYASRKAAQATARHQPRRQ